MYRVYANNTLIYQELAYPFVPFQREQSNSLTMIDPKLTLELNRGGTFTFTVDNNNYAYSKNHLDLLTTTIKIFQNERLIFEGRAVNESYDFYNRRTITCEGCLAYLSDTIIPSLSSFDSAQDLFFYIINYHNSILAKEHTNFSNKRSFNAAYGMNVFVNTGEFGKDIHYKTTFEVLQSLVETYGGHLRVIFDCNQDVYVVTEPSPTPNPDYDKIIIWEDGGTVTGGTINIEFAKNLLDLKVENKLDDFATIVYPLGKKPQPDSKKEKDKDIHKGGKFIGDGSELALGVEKYVRYYVDVSSAQDETQGLTELVPLPPPTPEYYDIEEDQWHEAIPDLSRYVVYSFPVGSGNKYILSTMNNRGYGLYIVADRYGNPLLVKMAANEEAMTLVTEEVITCPSGSDTLYIGWDNQFGSPDLWEYVTTDPQDEDITKHLGDDLLYTESAKYTTISGQINNDGTIIDYTKPDTYDPEEITGLIKADDIVYKMIRVTGGKSYVYTGAQKSGKGLFVITNNRLTPYVVERSNSGETLTYKEYYKFDVPDRPEDLYISIGNIIGGIVPHLWVYLEDEDEDGGNSQDYITIETVNNGVPYVYDKDLLYKYGRIEKTKVYEDVTSPEILLEKAKTYFFEYKKEHKRTLTVNAVDACLVEEGAVGYLPGQGLKVISEPNGIDTWVKVIKSEINLDKPQNNTFTFEEMDR